MSLRAVGSTEAIQERRYRLRRCRSGKRAVGSTEAIQERRYRLRRCRSGKRAVGWTEASDSGGISFARAGAGNPRLSLRPAAALRDRGPGLSVEWARRAARTEVVDARGGAVRRQPLTGAERGAEAAGDLTSRACAPSGRPGRAQPAPEPRARDRAARREAAQRARRAAPPSCDEADGDGACAPAGGEAAQSADEGAPTPAGSRIDSTA
jgi:hypothetical protein